MLRPFAILAILGLCCGGVRLPAAETPALDAYYAANALYNKQLYDLAAEEYRSFLTRFPRHEKVLYAKLGLALSYYEQENFAEAEPILAELAGRRDAPHQTQVHNLWGQCLLVAGKPGEAEDAFRWSVAHGKERFYVELPGIAERVEESPEISLATVTDLEPLERSLAGLSEALFQQRKWNQAVDTCRELIELVPDGRYVPRTRFILSLCLYEAGRYEEAETTLQALLESGADPAYEGRARFLLAESLREQGKFDAAATAHQRVSRSEQGDLASQALFRLGFVRFQQERFDQAALAFVDLRTRYPHSGHRHQAGLYLGRCRLQMQEYEAAQATFGDLTTEAEVAAEATLWLARTFLEQNQFENAREVAAGGIKSFGRSPFAEPLLFAQAQALLGLGELDAANKSLSRLEKSPDLRLRADAIRLRAFALHRSRAYDKSLQMCNEFLETFPTDPLADEVAFLKAENLFFADEREKASGAYRHFVPWQGEGPFTQRARFRLVQIHGKDQRWEAALTEAQPLLEQQPEEPFFTTLHYLAGVAAWHEQRWRMAADNLQAFAADHPQHDLADDALLRLARAFEEARQPEEAIRALTSLRDNYKGSNLRTQALVERGRLLEDAGEYTEAEKSLALALESAPDESLAARSRYRLAWLAVRQEDFGRAIDLFRQVSEQDIEPALASDALFQAGSLLVKTDRAPEAETLLGQYLENNKGGSFEADAAFSLGLALARQGTHERAAGVFRRYVTSYPEGRQRDRALYEWAWSERDLGRNGEAAELLEQLLKEHPRSLFADRSRLDLAEFAFEAENYTDCLARLDRLLADRLTDDVREPALYRRAWALLRREQDRAAAEAFEFLLIEYPGSEYAAVAAYQAGELRLAEKRFAKAHEHFLVAARSPGAEEVAERTQLRVGETHTLLNRWAEAEETFTSFLIAYPRSDFQRRAQMWLGWSQENQKEFEEAIAAYQKALAGGARDEVAARSQFQIGECLFALGQYDQAIKELVKVDVNYRFPEWTSRAILEIGQILTRKQQAAEAQQRFEEVIERYPGTDEAVLAQDLLEDFTTGKGIR